MAELSRKQGWITARVGEELVMMSTEADLYVGLTPVGTRIWEMIETPQKIDTICERLISEYAVAPEACRAEVEQFIADLVEHGAATLST